VDDFRIGERVGGTDDKMETRGGFTGSGVVGCAPIKTLTV
jgi:hypothetical protein